MSKKRPVMSHDPLAGLGDKEDGSAAGMQVADAGIEGQTASVGSTTGASGADGVIVALDSSLTITDVGDLHDTLLGHVTAMTPISIDASEVEVVDTAGLQLLAATFKTATANGLSVSLHNASAAFSSSARRIGLGAMLGVDNDNQAD